MNGPHDAARAQRAAPASATATGRGGGWRKLLRFVAIYGPGRTLYKAAGRLRFALPSWQPRRFAPDIGFIGCGQFAFATIGYFVQRRVLACYDPDLAARDSLARALDVRHAAPSADALLATPGLRTVYIASNHASHAGYAARALALGLDTYVEKPIAVSREQLVPLLAAARASKARLWAGYNRPFSGAVRELRRRIRIDPAGGFSLHCFVAGHVLAPDHWYRRPEEGTRICGNVGHWLDLFVHLLAWRGLPSTLDIALAWADDDERDDNLAVSITTDRHDLCSIMLTSRTEPFEGIHESIAVQHGDATARIDDFRALTLWQGERLLKRRYWPKDVGHAAALMQPFDDAPARDWREVEASTLVMLRIAQMVRAGERRAGFALADELAALDRDVAAAGAAR
jgi:predicted dehydrogenase